MTRAGQKPIRAAGARATASAPPLGLPRVRVPAVLPRRTRCATRSPPPWALGLGFRGLLFGGLPAVCVGPRAGPLCLGLRSLACAMVPTRAHPRGDS